MRQVEDKPDVIYNELGGCKEKLYKIREVVEISLLYSEKFTTLGINSPRNVLLYGPLGTGKTMQAKAVSNQTNASIIRIVGS